MELSLLRGASFLAADYREITGQQLGRCQRHVAAGGLNQLNKITCRADPIGGFILQNGVIWNRDRPIAHFDRMHFGRVPQVFDQIVGS